MRTFRNRLMKSLLGFLVLCASAGSAFADLTVGQIYPINLVDVDGLALSTADGHVTVMVVTTSDDVAKAETLGDRIPDFCLANPVYRMMTLVNFQKKRSAPTRVILRALIRRRLDQEARRLQTRYQAHGITRDARKDVFAAADFDGSILPQFGLPFNAGSFRVLVFGKNGELLKQWSDVPAAEELAAALKASN